MEPNVEVVHRALDAFNRGDGEVLFSLFDANVELYSTEDLPNGGWFYGREGYMEWVTAWLDAWEEFTVEPLESEVIDERHVVVDVRQHGRGRHSGVEIDMDTYYLWELRDGKIVRLQLHPDRAAALAAVQPA